jgi:hypothetical protein
MATTAYRLDARTGEVVLARRAADGWVEVDRMSANDAVRHLWHLHDVCNQAALAAGTFEGDAGPDADEVRVLDDAEADLPVVVCMADGSARVDLEFGCEAVDEDGRVIKSNTSIRDEVRLDRRLGDLGRDLL